MSDDLQNRLRRVNETIATIQAAASEMMKHYDRAAGAAVSEWRNALLQNNNSKLLLPLLYVANEVIQSSKRNRGTKFLEAFSPVLGQSLVYMAQKLPPPMTEKIRRTVKIWGERRVFSIRYVNELLKGLEPYREVKQVGAATTAFSANKVSASISPTTTVVAVTTANGGESIQEPKQNDKHDDDADNDDLLEILDEKPDQAGDYDDIFGDTQNALDIEVDVDATAPSHVMQRSNSFRQKRRRSSGSGVGTTIKKILSTTHLHELWNQLQENQKKFQLAQQNIVRIREALTPESHLANLIGDELQQAVQQHHMDCAALLRERRILHGLANHRRTLALEAARYLPWLEQSLQVVRDDIDFCDTLEAKLVQFQPIHMQLVATREVVRQEEAARQIRQEEAKRKAQEAEEIERFRRAALAKETEAKPGMVWNPTTREYQALNTDESWRD